MTPERKKELIEEAEGLYCSMGWKVPATKDKAEIEWFWNYVYEELGYDSCDMCGYYYDYTTFDEGYCETCYENAQEEE